MRSMAASHQKSTTTNWKHSWNWSSYNYMKSCPRTQCWPFYSRLAFEANWKVKKLGKWVPHELTENQKNCHFKVSSSLILCNNNKPFLESWRDEMWILYDNQWQLVWWLDQEAAPKYFPKPNLNQKEVMVTVSWSAAHLIHYSFLNPSETITSEKYAQQIDEMPPILQCLQLVLVNRKGPVLPHDNARPKVEWFGLQMVSSSTIFT